jgi:hypothetical protein
MNDKHNPRAIDLGAKARLIAWDIRSNVTERQALWWETQTDHGSNVDRGPIHIPIEKDGVVA